MKTGLTCELSCSLCSGNICRRCRRSGGWSCGISHVWWGCRALRRTWRTTCSRKSHPLLGSEGGGLKYGQYFKSALTFRDFFLFPLFFSYISMLRLTANIFLVSKFVSVFLSVQQTLGFPLTWANSENGQRWNILELNTEPVCWKRGRDSHLNNYNKTVCWSSISFTDLKGDTLSCQQKNFTVFGMTGPHVETAHPAIKVVYWDFLSTL